ncbi:GntR family transcriptional regulator [uncultured Martelella sp.]|uniref:GntR family transcriptional regulator n=1 Tax=uncultured Martelella sp. TaxID=392331 RepID=UPI0029C884EB|nr:GntR family transcriptional regulator [uncultured Martelella sp.]
MYDDNSPFSPKDRQKTPEPLKPVQKAAFAEERLTQAILWCELEPGLTITEAALATRFGLGRAATRVALARLSTLGFMLSIPREGWRVLPMSGALVGQVVDARRMAEPALASLTIDAQKSARLFELADMIEAVGSASEEAARTTRTGYERTFRAELSSELNPFVATFVERLWDHSDRIVHFFEKQGAAPMPALKASAIAAALRDGRADEARAFLDEAIEQFRSFASDALLNNQSELALTGGTKPQEKAPTQKQYGVSPQTGPDRAASRGWTSSKGNSS